MVPRRFRRPTAFAHRWVALVLGLILLVITTSGAALLYSPEWTRWTNEGAFHVTKSAAPITMTQAIAAVDKAHPDFQPATVNLYSGLYEVSSADEDAHPGFWGVDPGTGKITGKVYPDRGVMAFLSQLHECFFTCQGEPAYLPFLTHPIPGGLQFFADVTWGGLVLAFFGLVLVWLAVTGIVLWWPGIKRWQRGFRLRRGKGRYARDYDLHQLIGMAAIPFLLMWGVTGASFNLHPVKTAWYAVTGGHSEADDDTFASADVGKRKVADIGLDAAVAAGQAKAGASARLVYAELPAADDQTATYTLFFSRGFDQYRHGAYPGQYEVDVDRHDAAKVHVDDYGHADTLSNDLMDVLGPATFHFGESVNGWWRLIWFLFGLTPLALAVTGVSTWLVKRGVRKRRAGAGGAPPSPTDPTADPGADPGADPTEDPSGAEPASTPAS